MNSLGKNNLNKKNSKLSVNNQHDYAYLTDSNKNLLNNSINRVSY